MNVAELSLCKELYELSGWWQEDARAYGFNKKTQEYVLDYTPSEDYKKHIAAYDLGYLLRKLKGCSIEHQSNGVYAAQPPNYLTIEQRVEWGKGATTPEDAAAKLCIELFKQGILQKEKKIV